MASLLQCPTPDVEPIMPLRSDDIARLLDEHSAALTLYARQLCGEPDDVVQQAFLKLAGLRELPAAPLAWLYRVVRNEALSASRAARRRRRREKDALHGREKWFNPLEGHGIDVAAVTAALAALPTDQREVVTAHLWGGLTFREIGEVVGLSGSTAHRRYQEALERLREQLGVPCRKPE